MPSPATPKDSSIQCMDLNWCLLTTEMLDAICKALYLAEGRPIPYREAQTWGRIFEFNVFNLLERNFPGDGPMRYRVVRRGEYGSTKIRDSESSTAGRFIADVATGMDQIFLPIRPGLSDPTQKVKASDKENFKGAFIEVKRVSPKSTISLAYENSQAKSYIDTLAIDRLTFPILAYITTSNTMIGKDVFKFGLDMKVSVLQFIAFYAVQKGKYFLKIDINPYKPDKADYKLNLPENQQCIMFKLPEKQISVGGEDSEQLVEKSFTLNPVVLEQCEFIDHDEALDKDIVIQPVTDGSKKHINPVLIPEEIKSSSDLEAKFAEIEPYISLIQERINQQISVALHQSSDFIINDLKDQIAELERKLRNAYGVSFWDVLLEIVLFIGPARLLKGLIAILPAKIVSKFITSTRIRQLEDIENVTTVVLTTNAIKDTFAEAVTANKTNVTEFFAQETFPQPSIADSRSLLQKTRTGGLTKGVYEMNANSGIMNLYDAFKTSYNGYFNYLRSDLKATFTYLDLTFQNSNQTEADIILFRSLEVTKNQLKELSEKLVIKEMPSPLGKLLYADVNLLDFYRTLALSLFYTTNPKPFIRRSVIIDDFYSTNFSKLFGSVKLPVLRTRFNGEKINKLQLLVNHSIKRLLGEEVNFVGLDNIVITCLLNGEAFSAEEIFNKYLSKIDYPTRLNIGGKSWFFRFNTSASDSARALIDAMTKLLALFYIMNIYANVTALDE